MFRNDQSGHNFALRNDEAIGDQQNPGESVVIFDADKQPIGRKLTAS